MCAACLRIASFRALVAEEKARSEETVVPRPKHATDATEDLREPSSGKAEPSRMRQDADS